MKTPSLDELVKRSWVVRLPLVHSFRDISHREVMLFEGPERWGEWAPFNDYDDRSASLWLRSALEQAFDPDVPNPGKTVETVPVNAIFPSVLQRNMHEWWHQFPGVETAKLKIGDSPISDDNLRGIRAVRDTVGPDIALRLDVNGKWTLPMAEAKLSRLSEFNIDYLEQPVKSADDLRIIRRLASQWGIKIAADESVRETIGLPEIIRRGGVDIIVIKVGPVGGVRRAVELARRAILEGMEVVISSGLETSVGLSWGARAATSLIAEFGEAKPHGLATDALFAAHVSETPFRVSSGVIQNLEPAVDTHALRTYRVTEKRVEFWNRRLSKCLEHIVDDSRGHSRLMF